MSLAGSINVAFTDATVPLNQGRSRAQIRLDRITNTVRSMGKSKGIPRMQMPWHVVGANGHRGMFADGEKVCIDIPRMLRT